MNSTQIKEADPLCLEPSPSGKSSCYLDQGHNTNHYAPCPEHGDVNCGHQEEWPSKAAISTIASFLGRKGGKVKTEKKARAARENGRKGGRPKRVTPSIDPASSTSVAGSGL